MLWSNSMLLELLEALDLATKTFDVALKVREDQFFVRDTEPVDVPVAIVRAYAIALRAHQGLVSQVFVDV